MLAPSMVFAERVTQPKWTVDWGAARCTLQRGSGAVGQTFALWKIPGTPSLSLVVLNKAGKRSLQNRPAAVFLSGLRFPSDAEANQMILSAEKRGVSVGPLDDSFLDALSRAASIRVLVGDRTMLDTPLTETAKAISALKSCEDGLLKLWGVDPSTLSVLRRRPKAIGHPESYISPGDYPDSAIRANASGEVVVRILIGIDGRARECKAVLSSKNAALDARTCEIMTNRARFEPAVAADGTPTAAPSFTLIRWQL